LGKRGEKQGRTYNAVHPLLNFKTVRLGGPDNLGQREAARTSIVAT